MERRRRRARASLIGITSFPEWYVPSLSSSLWLIPGLVDSFAQRVSGTWFWYKGSVSEYSVEETNSFSLSGNDECVWKQELNIREFGFHQLNANLLWPGSFAFADWLVQHPHHIRNRRRCLEIGRYFYLLLPPPFDCCGLKLSCFFSFWPAARVL